MTWWTQYNSWSAPGVEDDPWLTAFETLFANVDAGVASLQASAYRARHCAVVVSMYPHAVVALTTASEAAPAAWTVLSAAPYGPADGAFTVLHSGAQAQLDFRVAVAVWTMSLGTYSTNANTSDVYAMFRVVLHSAPFSPAVRSFNATTDSAWKVPLNAACEWVYPRHTVVLSLGPGAYRATIEWRGIKRDPSASVGSYIVVSTPSYVTLLMHERFA